MRLHRRLIGGQRRVTRALIDAALSFAAAARRASVCAIAAPAASVSAAAPISLNMAFLLAVTGAAA